MSKPTLKARLRTELMELRRLRARLQTRYTKDPQAEGWFYKREAFLQEELDKILAGDKKHRRGMAS
jgi:hypothetical protein